MTALARFRAVLTLWLLVRSIFLLNWLSPSSEVAEDQEAQTADFVEITTRRKTQAIAHTALSASGISPGVQIEAFVNSISAETKY